MKPIYIYASRLRSFWVLVPMTVVLVLSLAFNGDVDTAMKLYPLIIFTVGAIIFTFVFHFRFIAISYQEIKYIGRFTSRDSATVNEGKTLVIELMEKKRVSIRLYGNEGYNPEIKWLTNENGEHGDICLFRGKAYGSGKYGAEIIAMRILTYLGVNCKDMDSVLSDNPYTATYENVTLTCLCENGHRVIKVRFDKTV